MSGRRGRIEIAVRIARATQVDGVGTDPRGTVLKAQVVNRKEHAAKNVDVNLATLISTLGALWGGGCSSRGFGPVKLLGSNVVGSPLSMTSWAACHTLSDS